LDDTDECRHNVSKRNKALFSNAEEKKMFRKMGNEQEKKKKKKLVYCCLESPLADD
jgi:hypothetical protein